MHLQARTPVTLRRVLWVLAFLTIPTAAGSWMALQDQAPTRREFHVTADGFAFRPGVIEAAQGDIVKVTFEAVDMAHSFTIDAYRIAKRAGSGQRVVFEFRADKAGRFPFYCNLTLDDRCSAMRGELLVR